MISRCIYVRFHWDDKTNREVQDGTYGQTTTIWFNSLGMAHLGAYTMGIRQPIGKFDQLQLLKWCKNIIRGSSSLHVHTHSLSYFFMNFHSFFLTFLISHFKMWEYRHQEEWTYYTHTVSLQPAFVYYPLFQISLWLLQIDCNKPLVILANELLKSKRLIYFIHVYYKMILWNNFWNRLHNLKVAISFFLNLPAYFDQIEYSLYIHN